MQDGELIVFSTVKEERARDRGTAGKRGARNGGREAS